MMRRRLTAVVVVGSLAFATSVVATSARAAEQRCTLTVPTNLGSTRDGSYTIVRSGDTVTVDFNVAGTSTLHCEETDPLNDAAVNITIHDHVVLKTGTDQPVKGDARIRIEDLNGVLFDGAAQIRGTGGCGPDVCDATYVSSDAVKKKKRHRRKTVENVRLNILMNLDQGDVVTYQIGANFFDRPV